MKLRLLMLLLLRPHLWCTTRRAKCRLRLLLPARTTGSGWAKSWLRAILLLRGVVMLRLLPLLLVMVLCLLLLLLRLLGAVGWLLLRTVGRSLLRIVLRYGLGKAGAVRLSLSVRRLRNGNVTQSGNCSNIPLIESCNRADSRHHNGP